MIFVGGRFVCTKANGPLAHGDGIKKESVTTQGKALATSALYLKITSHN